MKQWLVERSRLLWGDTLHPRKRALRLALVILVAQLVLVARLGFWYEVRLLIEARASVSAILSLSGSALSAIMGREYAALEQAAAYAQFGLRPPVSPPNTNQDASRFRAVPDDSPVLGSDGQALVILISVYRAGVFSGRMSRMLDLASVVHEAGLDSLSGYRLALRDADSRLIHGDECVFAEGPVEQIVDLPSGHWDLAAIPASGWRGVIQGSLLLYYGGGIVTSFLLASLVYLVVNRQTLLQLAVQERTRDLLRSRSRYQQLFDASPDALLVLGEDGRIQDANGAATRMYRRERSQLLGVHYGELWPEMSKQQSWPAPQSPRSGQERPEALHRRADGSLFPVDIGTTPLDVDGRPAMLVSIRDITERKGAEEALRQSEERYRMLFDEMITPFVLHEVVTDANGKVVGLRYLDANPAFERATGLSREKIVGQTLCEVFNPLPYEFWNETLGRVAMTGQSTHFTYLARALDKYHEVAAFSPKRGQVGLTIYEITERRRAEVALRDSEERYRALFENIGDAFILLDQNLCVTDLADARAGIFGAPATEILGRPLSDAFPELSVTGEDMTSTLNTVLREGGSRRFGASLRAMHPKDRIKYLDIVAYRVRVRGQPHAVLLCRNVSETRQLEIKLHQAQRLQALGRLASGVAHDFGNILAIVRTSCEVLYRNLAEDWDSLDEVRAIARAAESGMALTRELVAFSRGERPQLEILHLNALLRHAEGMLRRLAGEKVVLQMNLSDEPIFFWGDGGQFDRVLLNLATNACDAMPQGGTLTIQTRLERLDVAAAQRLGLREGPYAVMSVRDTGEGISEENRQRLFEPFFTTRAARKRAGLGLSVAYGVMQQHNGQISVESEPGRGTSFTVYLPALDEESISPQDAAEGSTLPRQGL